jgi:outer membrane protein OmpA-like peptidoglycan-associated protein
MSFRHILLAATVLAAPFALSHAAKAQPVTGPYVSLGGGYNINEGFKLRDDKVDEAKVRLHNGYTVDGSVGYGLGYGFRVEVEGDYFENTARKVTSYGTGTSVAASGKDQTYGAFVNALYDFDVGLPFLYPYIGAGVGYQIVDLKDLSFKAGVDTFYTNKSQGSLAYQGIAGLAFPLAAVPGLSATLEYRYTVDVGGSKYLFSNSNVDRTIYGKLNRTEDANNSFQVGLRYVFGVAPAPAPAPAPMASAPAPAGSRTYLVFFDWDKYNLTPRATDIIAQAASDSKTNATTTIDVSGYTDTSGTPTYNQGLSERRAQAVARKLVADGVPGTEISIHAYGETHLLVQTGPGVREPQNRRVEIVLD